MTLHEVSKQLFDLSVGGYFNHEKFTLRRLENYISKMTQDDTQKTSIIMEIALLDGWWYFEIEKLPQFGRNFYDYWIPDDREAESGFKIAKGINRI